MREMISSDPELKVAGEAGDGRQAVKMAKELSPDAIVLDIFMPECDGIWVAEQIFKETPVPIVLFSGAASPDVEITEELFQHGVLDVVKKPENPHAMMSCRMELNSKLKAAAKAKQTFLRLYRVFDLKTTKKVVAVKPAKSAIAVIASAGSPAVLAGLLKSMSGRCQTVEAMDSAVLVALHMPPAFLCSFAKSVAEIAACPVGVAKDGDIIKRKNVYFSPGDSTLCLRKTRLGSVSELKKPEVRLQPDFDLFLNSAVEVFGEKTTAIVLSGMGNYGLKGAMAIKKAGGKVIAQNPRTAGVSSMPESVLAAGVADASLSADEMTEYIFPDKWATNKNKWLKI